MTKGYRRLFATSAAVGLLAAPGAAFGLTSWQGDDYSNDSGGRMYACDKEADGRTAYSNFRPRGATSDSRVYDGNGSSSGCGISAQFSGIYSHQTCEQISSWPDACGARVYP